MSDIQHNSQKLGLRSGNSRSVMAVLSRVIAGVILSLMFQQYFSSQGDGSAFVTSRLWWEIALNFQLLSAGMMWFSYQDRIDPTPGPLRRLLLTKCWLAILAVLTPFAIGFVAVLNNWFVTKPAPSVILLVIGLAVVHLTVSLFVYGKIKFYRKRVKNVFTTGQRIAFFAPGMALVLLAVIDGFGSGTTWIIAAPMFVFLQGSMPYIMEIVGVTEPEYFL